MLCSCRLYKGMPAFRLYKIIYLKIQPRHSTYIYKNIQRHAHVMATAQLTTAMKICTSPARLPLAKISSVDWEWLLSPHPLLRSNWQLMATVGEVTFLCSRTASRLPSPSGRPRMHAYMGNTTWIQCFVCVHTHIHTNTHITKQQTKTSTSHQEN